MSYVHCSVKCFMCGNEVNKTVLDHMNCYQYQGVISHLKFSDIFMKHKKVPLSSISHTEKLRKNQQ